MDEHDGRLPDREPAVLIPEEGEGDQLMTDIAAGVSNLLTRPDVGTLVSASILSADFTRLASDCQAALDAGADTLHVDIMDGHFAPNLSMGPAVCAAVRRGAPEAFLDVHLMLTDPTSFLEPFAKAGADHCTGHIEVLEDPRAFRDRCHGLGMSAGIAINPETPLEALDGIAELFDLVLVMSVHPGFSGQSFIEPVLEKTRAIAARLGPTQRLEMDGGVAPANAAAVRAAGCDVLVAATAIFGGDDYATAIAALRHGGGG